MKPLQAFAIQSMIPTIIAATTLSCLPTLADEKKEVTFWKSVYQENHVVEIDIALTREAWEEMQPAQSERGGLGPRGGEPRREGQPERPPRVENGRPSGPPPGGRPGGPPPRGGGRGGAGSNFEYVKARLTIDGEIFKDSGLRFKGNSSYRMSADGLKRPFKIDTNRFVTGQELHGRTKLNLSNSFRDPAFMKEKLAYEVYQATGLPTPGTGWAKVTLTVEGVIEKQDLGIYVLIEQVNDDFLTRKLGQESQGSLLMKPEGSSNWQKPGDEIEQYDAAFNIKEGKDDLKQVRQFGEFLRSIEEPTDAEYFEKIGAQMDLDLYAGYLAATSLLASLDSYVASPHNYYLVFDKADQKARLLPWDVNEAFGTHTMGTTSIDLVKWDITKPWAAEIPLLERLFATEEFPKLYWKKLKTLMQETFTEKHLFARIATFEKNLKPHLNKNERASLQKGIQGTISAQNTFAIKPFIKQRIESVQAQLTGKSKGVKIEGRSGRSGQSPRERGGPPTQHRLK